MHMSREKMLQLLLRVLYAASLLRSGLGPTRDAESLANFLLGEHDSATL